MTQTNNTQTSDAVMKEWDKTEQDPQANPATEQAPLPKYVKLSTVLTVLSGEDLNHAVNSFRELLKRRKVQAAPLNSALPGLPQMMDELVLNTPEFQQWAERVSIDAKLALLERGDDAHFSEEDAEVHFDAILLARTKGINRASKGTRPSGKPGATPVRKPAPKKD